MNNDFKNLFDKNLFDKTMSEGLSPEEFLTMVCGLSPDDAKEFINSVKEETEE